MPWGFPSKSTMTLPFRRKRYIINEPDPSYQVVYLGNVLTAMAKGEGCVDKPLALIWKTYCSRSRPDLTMKLTVKRSGIKAETKQQGLTEYWSHRITHCLAPAQYPKVFCWVYKHEGKRMKPELRCHAVLCKKVAEPGTIRVFLEDALYNALQEYKREKISRQNARLNGTITGGCPSLPRRKQLKAIGAQNFRPPMSRSKSAPRLGTVLEDTEEEEEDVVDTEMVDCDEFVDNEHTPTCSGQPSPNSLNNYHSSSPPLSDGSDDAAVDNVEPFPLVDDDFSSRVDVDDIDDDDGALQADLDRRLRLDGNYGSEDYNPISYMGISRQMSAPQRLIRLGSSGDTEPDSVSDESGYHEKSSLEGDDDDIHSDDSCDYQITAF